MSYLEKYQPVIGLEVHAQLLTNSKAFSWDAAEFGAMPNTNITVISLAHPGTLPKFNKKALELAIKMGIACKCEISRYNIFDRKNYFYPDLPKGYQITQDKTPICKGGEITIKTKNGIRKIRLNRIHLEEDAGKSIHLPEETDTLVDLNRAGVPLIEIVTEPDIKSSDEAYAYLYELRKLVRYLEICDGNMEEGSLRCDANVSVMLKGASKLGKKVEVKNMNSIRNVQRAIDFEIQRQIELLESGNEVITETRTFDASTGQTYSMRTKEDLNDYRYFPDPDLQPIVVTEEWIQKIKESMPALPEELYEKFVKTYGLSDYDATSLTEEKDIALYFEEICKHTHNFKAAANWVLGAIKMHLNKTTKSIKSFELKPAQIAEIIHLVDNGKLSNTVAKDNVFPLLIENPSLTAEQIAKENDWIQESNLNYVRELALKALEIHAEKIPIYKAGKKGLLGVFMSEIMKASGGKADPRVASNLLKELLDG